MLSFLDGISPFYWIALSLVFAALVLVVSIDMLLWAAASALVVGILMVIVPDLSGQLQISLFAVLSVGSVVVARVWMHYFGGDREKVSSSLNDPLNRVMGKVGTVSESASGQGRVEIDGVDWQMRWEKGQASLDVGSLAKVIDRDGSTLIVQQYHRK